MPTSSLPFMRNSNKQNNKRNNKRNSKHIKAQRLEYDDTSSDVFDRPRPVRLGRYHCAERGVGRPQHLRESLCGIAMRFQGNCSTSRSFLAPTVNLGFAHYAAKRSMCCICRTRWASADRTGTASLSLSGRWRMWNIALPFDRLFLSPASAQAKPGILPTCASDFCSRRVSTTVITVRHGLEVGFAAHAVGRVNTRAYQGRDHAGGRGLFELRAEVYYDSIPTKCSTSYSGSTSPTRLLFGTETSEKNRGGPCQAAGQ